VSQESGMMIAVYQSYYQPEHARSHLEVDQCLLRGDICRLTLSEFQKNDALPM
jgi:hypothetical protein